MVDTKVTNPLNDGEGRNTHTTYGVETSLTFVRRRYSDFLWLLNRLETERPGAIIPMIPHQRALTKKNKFSDELIEERRRRLHIFLLQVCENPELVNAPSMTPFMTKVLGEEFDLAKLILEKANPNNIKEDGSNDADFLPHTENKEKGRFRRSMGNVAARAGVKMASYAGNIELEQTKEDPEINSIKEYLEEIETHVDELVAESTSMVHDTQKAARTAFKVGCTLLAWGSTHQKRYCPNGDEGAVTMLGKASNHAGELSTTLEEQMKEEHEHIEQGIKELALRVQAFKMALQKRKELQVTYTARIKQLQQRTTAIIKAQKQGKDASVIAQAERDEATAEEKAEIHRERLEQSSARFIRESRRIQPLLEDALKLYLNEYARIQIEYYAKKKEMWSILLPHLKYETPSYKADKIVVDDVVPASPSEVKILASPPMDAFSPSLATEFFIE